MDGVMSTANGVVCQNSIVAIGMIEHSFIEKRSRFVDVAPAHEQTGALVRVDHAGKHLSG